MRCVLALILLASAAAPAAAFPAMRPDTVSVAKAQPLVQVAKKSKAPAQRQRRGGDSSGGIHPLVGSGGY